MLIVHEFTHGPWGGLQILARIGCRALWIVKGAVGLASAALLSRVVRPSPTFPAPTASGSPIAEPGGGAEL
jgi:hypothetical protein